MTTATILIPSARLAESNRILGFDLLRGICAIAVAFYHLLDWNNLPGLGGSWGTYAVYVFFVLSGASMYVAYADKLSAGYSASKFLVKRMVRLMPLYLVAVVLSSAIAFGDGLAVISMLGKGYLNASLLFGLGLPGATSAVTGGWSLGIEFVFYLMFPVVASLVAGRAWWLVVLAAFIGQHVFVNAILQTGTLETRWVLYTQPLSFIFYFAAGCAIGRAVLSRTIEGHTLGPVGLAASLAILGTTFGSDGAELVGITGIALSLVAVFAVVAAASTRIISPMAVSVAQLLGVSSYGVYLLHPLLRTPVEAAAKVLGVGGFSVVTATVICSMFLALVLHRYLEIPVRAYFEQRARA